MARTDQPHKLTFDAFVARCSDMSLPVNAKNAGLDYSRPETRAAWNGIKSKIPIWCTAHAEFFVQLAANHMVLGQGCPKCGSELRTRKRTKADPVADFRAVHGDTYDYSDVVYVNVHTPVSIICPAHGPFSQKPNAHIAGQGCPACWANRRSAMNTSRSTDYKEAFPMRAAQVHAGAYALLSLPENSHDTVLLNCPKHGDFTQKAYSHLDGHGCPTCGRVTSYTQRELAAFIEGLGVTIKHDNRTVLNGLHIDIWAPAQRIGIEYHGCYWHTQSRVGDKHREKWERATAAGVRLIQIFDFEWIERRPAVENRLRALFGACASYDARKCELRVIATAQARAFLKENHTQGSAPRATVCYGLYVGPALVACMTLGPSRYSASGWELLRYASVGRVRGGFSRMLAAFVRDHEPDAITSYCDLRWGDGRVYATSGFVLDGLTPPDYWYVLKEKRVSRYAAQNRPKGQTERAWAEENGYEKVLGVGHQRWVWRPHRP